MSGAPTLVIGIGGFGSRTVAKLAAKVRKESPNVEHNLRFAVLDTDANDLRNIKKGDSSIVTIQTSPNLTIGEYLDRNPDATRWFPDYPVLRSKSFTEGAGQVRAISRLALESSMDDGTFSELHKAIRELREVSTAVFEQAMRIIVVGTITGGTGAGLALPLGLHLRNYLNNTIHQRNAIIRGFFVLPGVLAQNTPIGQNPTEVDALGRNAYATVRELNAFMLKGDGVSMDGFTGVEFDIACAGGASREVYDAIRPYDYCFLMDAQNTSANFLSSMDAYTEFAVNTIYAQSLSPMSAVSNSSEDNVIQELVRNEIQVSGSNGRYEGYTSSSTPRFAAAGAAEITYPFEEVSQYLSLVLADRSVSTEWLAADKDVARKQKEEIETDARDETPYSVLYAQFYESVSDRDEFNHGIANMINQEAYINERGERVPPRDLVASYIAALEQFIKTTAENSQSIRRKANTALTSIRDEMNNAPKSAAELKSRIKENGTSAFDALDDHVSEYRTAVLATASQEAASVAKKYFSLVSTKYNDPLDVADDENYRLESFLQGRRTRNDASDATTCLHPNAVRYFLARAEIQLENALADAKKKRGELEARVRMQASMDWDEGDENDQTSFGEAVTNTTSHVSPLKSAINALLDKLNKEAEDFTEQIEVTTPDGKTSTTTIHSEAQRIIGELNKHVQEVREYHMRVIGVAVYSAALDYVRQLSEAYHQFYRYLETQIPEMQRQIELTRSNPKFNATAVNASGVLGQATRYVCCDVDCLDRMFNEMVIDTNSLRVSGTLCAQIYDSLYEYAYDQVNNRGSNYARSLQRKSPEEYRKYVLAQNAERFQGIFNEAIVGYWKGILLTNHGQVVDMDIIDAIRREAIYRSPSYADEKECEAYVREVLNSGFNLSRPLLESVGDGRQRTIKACLYSKDLGGVESRFGGTDESKTAIISEVLKANGGYADDALSKYRVLFYQSCYGIRARQIPSFSAPEDLADYDSSSASVGSYYRAYHNAIDSLGPDLRKNSLVTPHLDTRWHLIGSLPEISASEEHRQKYRIMRSFVYALLFGVVERKDAEPKPIYRLKWSNGDTESLRTSNGTSCDHFYEVFDALGLNPQAVKKLLAAAEDSMAKEIAGGATSLGPAGSRMVRNLRSNAFGEVEPQPNDRVFKVEEFDDSLRSVFDIPLLYCLSLPKNELRTDSTKSMVEMCFDIVGNYLGAFSGENIDKNLATFYLDQYSRFENNLVTLCEQDAYRNAYAMDVVDLIRSKVMAWFEEDHAIASSMAQEARRCNDYAVEYWRQTRAPRSASRSAAETFALNIQKPAFESLVQARAKGWEDFDVECDQVFAILSMFTSVEDWRVFAEDEVGASAVMLDQLRSLREASDNGLVSLGESQSETLEQLIDIFQVL